MDILTDKFTELYREVQKDKKNVYACICITGDEERDHIRMAMHGNSDSILAAVCCMIHKIADESDTTTTDVLLRIAGAMEKE